MTLEASRNRVTFGKSVIFSGLVDSANAGCESGQTVKIQQQAGGAAGFSQIGTATTSSSGAFTFSHQPAENATYRAVVDPSSQCQEAISNTEVVAVRVKVGLRASDNRVRKGSKVNITVTIAPCGNHADSDVVLQRSTGGQFKEIARKGVNEACRATFKTRIKKTSRFQARWPSQDDNHESGISGRRKVRAVKRGF